jgi:hypothetical protein
MPDPADPLKESCDYAMDLTKQFLTLSAAGIAFVVGLVFADRPAKICPCVVGWTLSLFGASIAAGLAFQMRMIGKVHGKEGHDVFGGFTQAASFLQILLFAVAVALLFFPTVQAARVRTPDSPAPAPVYLVSAPGPAKVATPTPAASKP